MAKSLASLCDGHRRQRCLTHPLFPQQRELLPFLYPDGGIFGSRGQSHRRRHCSTHPSHSDANFSLFFILMAKSLAPLCYCHRCRHYSIHPSHGDANFSLFSILMAKSLAPLCYCHRHWHCSIQSFLWRRKLLPLLHPDGEISGFLMLSPPSPVLLNPSFPRRPGLLPLLHLDGEIFGSVVLSQPSQTLLNHPSHDDPNFSLFFILMVKSLAKNTY